MSAASHNFTTYPYKTVGDLKIELDVYTPAKPAPESGYPVLFTIHGGGYIQGTKDGGLTSQERIEALNRGWVIVSIDYRLTPGAVLQEIVPDVQDAYAWVCTELVKKTPINPNLIAVLENLQVPASLLSVATNYPLVLPLSLDSIQVSLIGLILWFIIPKLQLIQGLWPLQIS